MMLQKSEHSFNPSQIDHMIKTWTEFGLSPKVFENPEMDYDDLNNSENIEEERESTKLLQLPGSKSFHWMSATGGKGKTWAI